MKFEVTTRTVEEHTRGFNGEVKVEVMVQSELKLNLYTPSRFCSPTGEDQETTACICEDLDI